MSDEAITERRERNGVAVVGGTAVQNHPEAGVENGSQDKGSEEPKKLKEPKRPAKPKAGNGKPVGRKPAKPKAGKKPKTEAKNGSKAKPKKSSGKEYSKEENQADRESAKTLGLGLIHFRVLRAMHHTRKGKARHGSGGDLLAHTASGPGWMTYRDIEAATGYYAPLAGIMHTDEEYGLIPLGMATTKKFSAEENNREKMYFRISAKGMKLIEKLG